VYTSAEENKAQRWCEKSRVCVTRESPLKDLNEYLPNTRQEKTSKRLKRDVKRKERERLFRILSVGSAQRYSALKKAYRDRRGRSDERKEKGGEAHHKRAANLVLGVEESFRALRYGSVHVEQVFGDLRVEHAQARGLRGRLRLDGGAGNQHVLVVRKHDAANACRQNEVVCELPRKF